MAGEGKARLSARHAVTALEECLVPGQWQIQRKSYQEMSKCSFTKGKEGSVVEKVPVKADGTFW